MELMSNRIVALATATALAVPLLYVLTKCRPARPTVGERVVFLDLDGVVNTTKRADQIILVPELVDKLRRIVEPTDDGQQQVQIVLSTFWRPFLDYVAYALWRHGVPGELVVDATPGRSKSKTCIQTSCVRHLLNPTSLEDESFFLNRAAEIRVRLRLLFTQPLKLTYPNSTLAALAQQEFLRRHPQVQKFVILDDRKDAADGEDLLPFFINTDPSVGLTEEHVARARGFLS
jgi:hypothetical protein